MRAVGWKTSWWSPGWDLVDRGCLDELSFLIFFKFFFFSKGVEECFLQALASFLESSGFSLFCVLPPLFVIL